MAFYFREIPDPKNKGKVIIERIADEEANEDDILYQIPGCFYQYNKLKILYDTYERVMKEIFDKNGTVDTGKGLFVPKPFQSQYDDEVLAKIERDNTKIEVNFVPHSTNGLSETEPIKIEGKYVPEAITFSKIIDHSAIPVMNSISRESIEKQRQIESKMPFIKQIKQGGLIRIIGNHLKIRPTNNKIEGLFFIDAKGIEHDITDFIKVNSLEVLLLAIPIDFPIGEYTIYIRSGWYADPSIIREGKSDFSLQVI